MTDREHMCDFGGGCEPPEWLYGCAHFVVMIAGERHTSVSGWFACDACAAAIDQGWDAMIERAFTSGGMGRVDPRTRRALVQWYSAFWRNRDGTKTRITERDREVATALQEELMEDDA
jgi:hypothetical protein